MSKMTIIYDVLLKQRAYRPLTGYYGEPQYICIFYSDDKEDALKEMRKYVKTKGFVTPDRKYTVENVVLRERTATGDVIGITPYYKLFDVITNEPISER